jgi:hypothetical protein
LQKSWLELRLAGQNEVVVVVVAECNEAGPTGDCIAFPPAVRGLDGLLGGTEEGRLMPVRTVAYLWSLWSLAYTPAKVPRRGRS